MSRKRFLFFQFNLYILCLVSIITLVKSNKFCKKKINKSIKNKIKIKITIGLKNWKEL
jgi:hypothetical protein